MASEDEQVLDGHTQPERPKPRQLQLSDILDRHSNLTLGGNTAKTESEKGRLKIFLGAAAGVGKTYAMLEEAQGLRAQGRDVVIGYVELHGRDETERLLTGLEAIPRKEMQYRGTALQEMDTDALIARKPQLALVDELAHTNPPGLHHEKRYEDIEEILEHGIDVYSTVNIQHLESLNDRVYELTGTRVRETFPDRLFDLADEVVVIDLPPNDLRERIRQGKVYRTDKIEQALQNFFNIGNLTALRELALARSRRCRRNERTPPHSTGTSSLSIRRCADGARLCHDLCCAQTTGCAGYSSGMALCTPPQRACRSDQCAPGGCTDGG